MKLKTLKEPFVTSDPYYDLFDGGYIKPEEFLEDEADVKTVKDAIKIVEDFLQLIEGEELLEVEQR
jgi:hypothetical protein